MRHLKFPTEAVEITQFNMAFEPQGATRTGITGLSHTTRYGPGRWTGTVQFGVKKRTDAEASVVEAFLSEMEGAANTTDLPLYEIANDGTTRTYARPVVDVPGNTKVASTSIVNDAVVTRFSQDIADMKIGHLLTIGNRLFMITGLDGNDDRAILLPQMQGLNGRDVTVAESIRVARRDDTPANLPQNSNYGGPWTVSFTERLI